MTRNEKSSADETYDESAWCTVVPNFLQFWSYFPKNLFEIKKKEFWLNDNHLLDTPVNLQSCNFAQKPNWKWCVTSIYNFCCRKMEFTAFSNCLSATYWAEIIPKSVTLTGFPKKQFKYLVYFVQPKLLWPPETVIVVGGCFQVWILSSCHGHSGCRWYFLVPLTCIIPCADSCTIICTVHQWHCYKLVFPALAGGWGDEHSSQSFLKQQASPSFREFSDSSVTLLLINFACFQNVLFLVFFWCFLRFPRMFFEFVIFSIRKIAFFQNVCNFRGPNYVFLILFHKSRECFANSLNVPWPHWLKVRPFLLFAVSCAFCMVIPSLPPLPCYVVFPK